MDGEQNYKGYFMTAADQELEQRFLRLPNLQHVGLALFQFVRSLHPNGTFVKKETDWVFEPNFVAFGFPKRGEKIRMHVDLDIPIDLDEKDRAVLQLFDGRWHYPVCEIKNARELACAVRYIEGAFRKRLRKLGKAFDTLSI